MNRRKLTPQEKKLLSYLKDTRNTFAESRSRSRFAIAKRKAYGHQSLRHSQKLTLNKLVKVSEIEMELVESEMKSHEPKKWRKLSDSALGEFVSILLRSRTERGINENLKTSQILEKAKRLSKEKWKSSRW